MGKFLFWANVVGAVVGVAAFFMLGHHTHHLVIATANAFVAGLLLDEVVRND